MPIGVYFVRPNGEFVLVSTEVRHLLGLPKTGSVDKFSISNYYANPAHREKLLKKVREEHKNGKVLSGEIIHFRVNEKDLYLENYCKPVYHPDSEDVIGYYGCLLDRTKEHESKVRENTLKQKIEDLTYDIGRVLHANSTTLVMVKQSLKATLNMLTVELNEQSITEAEITSEGNQLLEDFTFRLLKPLKQVIEFRAEKGRTDAFPIHKWNIIKNSIIELEEYKEIAEVAEGRSSFLRETALAIIKVFQQMKPGIPRELAKESQRLALELLRITTMIPVKKTHVAVIQMDQTLRSLRDYVTTDVRIDVPMDNISVATIIDESIITLGGFAKERNIEIRIENKCSGSEVMGVERDLVRMFTNILHNAIKYSWTRSIGTNPWVLIKVACDNNEIFISCENWGVAISQNEIKKGLIFNLGYRGELSKDRSRLGTGIGLTDSMRVIELHGGRISISSRPSSFNDYDQNDPEFYKQPFITSVDIVLKKH